MTFFTSWKTTIGGIILAIAQILPQLGVAADIVGIVSAIGAVILGASAKDSNVTGGTKQQ